MRRSADPRRRGSAGLASMGISKERDGRVTVGRAESTPGASAEADPGLEEGEEGTPKWILKGRPACGVPAVLSPGLIGRDASSRRDHRSSGTLCGAAPCGAAFGVPLAPYGRARLVVAGGRMSSGLPVRRLTAPF